MLRHAAWLLLTLATTACGSVDYRDSNAAVSANPSCVSAPDQPNQPVSKACERTQEASWSSERKAKPVDLSGKDGDDR